MAGLANLVREEVEKYAVKSLNATLYTVFDESRQIYTVLSVKKGTENQPARAIVMARVVGDSVIIEADTTDKAAC